jgi:hypothetical protein
VWLGVTGSLLLGWLAWLAATALSKTHEPIVSRAQAAGAPIAVRARISAGDPDRTWKLAQGAVHAGNHPRELKAPGDRPAYVVDVVERLTTAGPDAKPIGVSNLIAVEGYTGPGEYLLLLVPDKGTTIDGHEAFFVVGSQRSPAANFLEGGPLLIYRWGPDVAKQAARLFPSHPRTD